MKAGRLLSPLFAVILLGASSSAARGTNVCGTYTTNQTWTTAGSPYIATCDVSISGGATLTINAGVQVKFNQNTGLFIGNGSTGGLSAVGTSAQHITFTANTASPTAGYWQGIIFKGQTTSASQIRYSDVFYGGGFNHGGIHVSGITGAFPVIANVKAENNAYAGIRVQGGSPPISSSTIRFNPIGIEVGFGVQASAPSITSTTISSNTGYALNIDANVTLGTVSSLTISSNGTNAASISGIVAVNTTWKSLGTNVPYVLAAGDVEIRATTPPTLTIPAGLTVKFNAGRQLVVGWPSSGGGLQANGTSSQPITFTANSGSPAPGFWRFIIFYQQALASSKISYATITYAEKGVYFYNGPAATIDHVTFTSNQTGAATLNSSPTFTNCNFSSNTAGFNNESPATIVTARFNWWNHLSGPSGAGPGTGQSVSSGVKFEPWLGATASTPRYFTTFSLGNSTFNPQIGINTNFSFVTTPSGSGSWTFGVYNSSGVLVRTITGTGVSGSPVWDGKNDSAVLQPNGLYTYTIDCTGGGSTASPLRGRVTLDTTLQFAVNNLTVAPAFFSPNSDGIQETTTLTAVCTFDGASWTVNVKNSEGTTVRTATGAANPNIAYTWDGKNASAVVQPDGVYTLQLIVTDGPASTSASPTVTLDSILPVATITAPTSGQTLSNVYQTGSAMVNVNGTATDTNLSSWSADYGAGSAPSSWTNLATGTTAVSSGTFVAWNTLTLTNGTFTVRVLVQDKAGNSKVATKTVTVGNFSVSKNTIQFSGGTGGTVTYTSIVPFTLTETLSIKNQSGLTVRTLVNAVSRGAGTYTDVWNGKNGSAVLQPDGGYFDVTNVTAGANSMTWDLTNQFVGGGFAFSQDSFFYNLPPFMPYNNIPLNLVPQVLTVTGRQYWLFVSDLAVLNPESPTLCNQPPNFCTTNGDYRATNSTFQYSGTDPSGKFRPDIIACVLMNDLNSFSKNAVVLYGTMPSVTNVTASPSVFSPRGGAQTIAFDVASFQKQTTTVTITLKNQESLTVLRTLTLNAQAPGHVTRMWDGKAGNGMWVAPGAYVVEVTDTDSLGNAASARILTTVSY